ncbi:hypothetical protein K1719_024569 [Acacia pycnantha]|nr:hypothetical protein K1719_024569 [Acacia pycnantha]
MNAMDTQCNPKEAEEEDDQTTQRMEGQPGALKFTVEEYSAWCLPWMNSLIIKVLGASYPTEPFEFYNVESWRRISNMVGRMIKVDRSTSVYGKGGFARICVEIDLKQPLLPSYKAKDKQPTDLGTEDNHGSTVGREIPVGGGPTLVTGGPDEGESPFGKLKILRRDFCGVAISAELGQGINGDLKQQVDQDVSGKENGYQRPKLKKEGNHVNNNGIKREKFKAGDLQKFEWIKVGAKRKNVATGKSRGKENKGPASIMSKGYSGGIWCLWEPTISHVTVLECHHQYMHLQVTGSTGSIWTLTVVYASPSCVSRRTLWDKLSHMAPTVQGAWLVGGDLNGTMLHGERRSSANSPCTYDHDLVRWVDTHDMRDVGFVRPEFTWKRGTSEARLDRMLVNDQWLSMFPDASVVHLPFFKSDHKPILLRLATDLCMPRPNRPFRFIAAWTLHAKFDEFVKETWRQDTSWPINMSQFTQACSEWNKEVFRHTEKRKKHLLRRLDGINRVVARHGMQPQYENLHLSL